MVIGEGVAMKRIPKSGEFYRHFKNKMYQIITVAEHSEDGQKLVVYQALYGDFKTYARPLEMFMSEVDHEKYPEVKQQYRFERVVFAEEVKMEKDVPKAEDVIDIHEEIEETCLEASEEGMPHPGLMEFLDTDDWDMKYNVLVSLRDKMTDKLVDDLAVVLDVVIPEGPLDKRYEELKICVRTRQKYESQHLR